MSLRSMEVIKKSVAEKLGRRLSSGLNSFRNEKPIFSQVIKFSIVLEKNEFLLFCQKISDK